jgi:hypothetical protein
MVCIVALGGYRPMVADDKKADAPPTTSDKYGKMLDQLAAAETLIEFGKSHNSPLALLAAADVIYQVEIVEGGFKDAPTVEGGKVMPYDPEEMKGKLTGLIKAARAMKGSKAVEEAAKSLEGKVLEGGRGTPQGGTSATVRLDKNGTAKVTRQFIAKQVGKIWITRDSYNPNVPLKYTLTDSSGNVVPHVVGAANQFAFIPTVDGPYKLVITNNNPYDTDAVVSTN